MARLADAPPQSRTAPAVPRLARWPLVAVALLGLASELLYLLALVRPYWLPRYVDRPLVDLGKIGGYEPAAGVRYGLPLALLWGLYLAAGVAARRLDRWLLPLACGGALLFALTLLWLYPITAADIFNYLLYGLVEHRGANPLVQPPDAVIGEPLIGFSAWRGHPSPYGPVWQRLAYLITAVTGESLLAGILGFKLLLVACHLLNTGLVARLARATGSIEPGTAALLYAWNPLLLYETAGNGHNDVVMLTAALLAAWALCRPRGPAGLALPITALGVLVKYVAAIWAPIVLLAAWHRERGRGPNGPRRLILWAAASALLALALFWPYWSGGQTLEGVRRQADLYTTSLASVTMVLLSERSGLIERQTLLDALKGVALAGVAATAILRRPRDGGVRSLLAALFDVTLAYLLLGALWFQPWYLVPLVGLAQPLDVRRRLLAAVYALGAFGSYLVYFYVWPALDWTGDRLLIQGLAAGVAHGPVLLALLAFAVHRIASAGPRAAGREACGVRRGVWGAPRRVCGGCVALSC